MRPRTQHHCAFASSPASRKTTSPASPRSADRCAWVRHFPSSSGPPHDGLRHAHGQRDQPEDPRSAAQPRPHDGEPELGPPSLGPSIPRRSTRVGQPVPQSRPTSTADRARPTPAAGSPGRRARGSSAHLAGGPPKATISPGSTLRRSSIATHPDTTAGLPRLWHSASMLWRGVIPHPVPATPTILPPHQPLRCEPIRGGRELRPEGSRRA